MSVASKRQWVKVEPKLNGGNVVVAGTAEARWGNVASRTPGAAPDQAKLLETRKGERRQSAAAARAKASARTAGVYTRANRSTHCSLGARRDCACPTI